MKKITSGLSIIIVAAMLFSLMPLNVFAAGSDGSSGQASEAETTVVNDDLTVSGGNSFGDLLADRINRSGGNESSPVEGYSVTGITMDGKTATVEYNAVADCLLIVAVYTDDGIRMLGSGKKTVSAEEKTAEVPVSIDEMPQYYLLKAFLVNPENYNPLSNAFTCELYTQSIQEVVNSSIDDYEGREVLNLDSNDDTNFAVYNKKVSVIGESAGSNIYQPAASDPDIGKYVFANADSDFTSLKAGDIFSYTSGDELIIGKVRSISVTHNDDGTDTVTVRENSDIELTDVFDYVKIENNDKIDSYELDDSAADEGLSDINPSVRGLTKAAKISVEGSKDFVDIQKHIHKKKKIDAQSEEISDEAYAVLDADFKLKITFHVTAYASFQNCYIDMSINSDASLNGTVTGSVSLDITLPAVSAKFAGGSVNVGFTPKLKFNASAEITIDATFEYKVGFNCSTSDGLVNTSDKKPTFKLNVKVEGELYFGVVLTPSVTFVEVGVGITKHYLAKLNMPMEVGLKVTGELKSPSGHACEKCIDGEIHLLATIKPSVKLLVKKTGNSESAKKEYSKTLLDKDLKVEDWYYWVRIQSFSTADTCAWTPTVAGRYNVYCDIADENGTVLAYKGIEFVIGNAGTTDYTFITSVESPQPMNTSVTLTATGGASYKFYYEVGGKWATVQNFSSANTATWTPDMIADYTLYVDIKNSSGKVVKTLSKKFSATDPYSFTADMASPQNIGKSVKFTAAGGASYKFYYQYSGAWVKIQDSTSATCNWKPNKAGEYMVYEARSEA